MNVIKNKDFIFCFFAVLYFLTFSLLNYYVFGSFLYDTGREFLVSEALLNKVKFSEIFISYPPLSYMVNGWLFKIFSSSLDTLRIAGLISGMLTVVFMYKISRIFTTEIKSLIGVISVVSVTMFNVSYIHNYIMGYSYGFIYGVLFSFVSLYLILNYLKNDKFLYPAFFTLGLCVSLKLEFVFLIFPYTFVLFYKKESIKRCFISFILFFLPIILSYILAYGFKLSNYINYFLFLKAFLSSKLLAIYNYNVFILEPKNWILYNLKSFMFFITGLFLSYLFLFFPLKYKNKVLFFILFIFLFILYKIPSLSASSLFSWLVFSNLAILIYSIKNKNLCFMVFSLFSLFLCFRFNFIFSNGYLAYIMPSSLLLFIIFSINTKNEIFNKILSSFLIILSLQNVIYFTLSQKALSNFEIKTNKGKMLINNEKDAKVINEIIGYLNKIDKNNKVLILPDGAMFNYLTDTKTDLRYYQLLPNHIEALKEENIVKNLELSPPNYVIFLNTDFSIYSTPLICQNFGIEICNFVYKNCKKDKTFNEGSLKADIYKFD